MWSLFQSGNNLEEYKETIITPQRKESFNDDASSSDNKIPISSDNWNTNFKMNSEKHTYVKNYEGKLKFKNIKIIPPAESPGPKKYYAPCNKIHPTPEKKSIR
mmetsp:Transcript_24879/g.27529  ORF Transcript_24879/g.27529 Transcript_24879/m.27529 type:complete len:103 (-) Transcript_24879:10-318(-)